MRSFILLLALSALAPAAPRRILLVDGTADFEWLSASSFRITRTWGARNAEQGAASLVLESSVLKVDLDTRSLLAKVATKDGKPVAEISGPLRAPGKIVLERKLAAGEQIYGNTGSASADPPFFFSSLGYGQLIGGAIKYLIERRQDSLRVTTQGSDSIEYSFLYGPTPKEIFDQRKLSVPVPESLPLRMVELNTLTCEAVRQINSESLAATLYAVNAGPRWDTFLGAYMREIHDRGLPVFRPLAMQFPKDPNASHNLNVTMFGDEMLIAPKCASPLTLPQGLWTDTKTNVEHKSRSTVELADEVTIFARNGTIVPIHLPDKVELHYFPKLGAEFFLFEPSVNDYSQVHASQAGDFWRLEIESKVARTYEWVLHHIENPPKRIKVEAKAGGDEILNLPVEQHQ
jgi:hypothetical protein